MSGFEIIPQNLEQDFDGEEEKVMNPETDCPVCYMNMESHHMGENCEHVLCEPCFQTIINTTNKCPICREDLINNHQNHNDNNDNLLYVFDEEIHANQQFLETIDYDDLIPGQREIIFEGDDAEPTDNLFNGRKWFDVATQQLKIWINGEFRIQNEILATHEYEASEINLEFRRVYRNYDNFNTHQNCPFCGIQRTKEANKYLLERVIINAHNHEQIDVDFNIGIVNIETQYCWGTNAFDGQGLNCCLSCWLSS